MEKTVAHPNPLTLSRVQGFIGSLASIVDHVWLFFIVILYVHASHIKFVQT